MGWKEKRRGRSERNQNALYTGSYVVGKYFKNYYSAAANNNVFGGLRKISPSWSVWKTQKDLKTKSK